MKILIVLVAITFISSVAFCQEQTGLPTHSEIATQDALVRNWNVYSSGYDYQKASASDLKVSKVELAEGSTYKVTGTLTITHSYPQWNYSWTETKEVEYYVDTSTSKVTRIIYDPNNQWGRTVIDIFTDHEVMTRNYTYTWGDHSSTNSTTITTYFDINGNRITEQGTEAYTSSYKGTQNYNYQRSWNTAFNGNIITTDSTWSYTYNGTQQSSGSQKTVSVYSDTGSLLSRTDTHSSTYDNYKYVSDYYSTYDAATKNILTTGGSYTSTDNGKVINGGTYSYIYDGTSNWNPVTYTSEYVYYNQTAGLYNFSANGKTVDGVEYSFNGTGQGPDLNDGTTGTLTITRGDVTSQYNVSYNNGKTTVSYGDTILELDGIIAFTELAIRDYRKDDTPEKRAKQAQEHALAFNWNVLSYGYDYTKAECNSAEIQSVEKVDDGYKVKLKLSISRNYYGYSYSEEKEVEYLIGDSGEITQIIYDTANDYSRTTITFNPDGTHTRTKSYIYRYGDYSYTDNMTVTVSFNAQGRMATEHGSQVSSSSYAGTVWDYTRNWDTALEYRQDGNVAVTTSSSYSSSQGGTVQWSGDDRTATVYSQDGSTLSSESTYHSLSADYESTSSYSQTFDPATHNVVTQSGSYASFNKALNRMESRGSYSYTYDGTSNWNPVSYTTEYVYYNQAAGLYNFYADGKISKESLENSTSIKTAYTAASEAGQMATDVTYTLSGTGSTEEYCTSGSVTVTDNSGSSHYEISTATNASGDTVTYVSDTQNGTSFTIPGLSGIPQIIGAVVFGAVPPMVNVPKDILQMAISDFKSKVLARVEDSEIKIAEASLDGTGVYGIKLVLDKSPFYISSGVYKIRAWDSNLQRNLKMQSVYYTYDYNIDWPVENNGEGLRTIEEKYDNSGRIIFYDTTRGIKNKTGVLTRFDEFLQKWQVKYTGLQQELILEKQVKINKKFDETVDPRESDKKRVIEGTHKEKEWFNDGNIKREYELTQKRVDEGTYLSGTYQFREDELIVNPENKKEGVSSIRMEWFSKDHPAYLEKFTFEEQLSRDKVSESAWHIKGSEERQQLCDPTKDGMPAMLQKYENVKYNDAGGLMSRKRILQNNIPSMDFISTYEYQDLQNYPDGKEASREVYKKAEIIQRQDESYIGHIETRDIDRDVYKQYGTDNPHSYRNDELWDIGTADGLSLDIKWNMDVLNSVGSGEAKDFIWKGSRQIVSKDEERIDYKKGNNMYQTLRKYKYNIQPDSGGKLHTFSKQEYYQDLDRIKDDIAVYAHQPQNVKGCGDMIVEAKHYTNAMSGKHYLSIYKSYKEEYDSDKPYIPNIKDAFVPAADSFIKNRSGIQINYNEDGAEKSRLDIKKDRIKVQANAKVNYISFGNINTGWLETYELENGTETLREKSLYASSGERLELDYRDSFKIGVGVDAITFNSKFNSTMTKFNELQAKIAIAATDLQLTSIKNDCQVTGGVTFQKIEHYSFGGDYGYEIFKTYVGTLSYDEANKTAVWRITDYSSGEVSYRSDIPGDAQNILGSVSLASDRDFIYDPLREFMAEDLNTPIVSELADAMTSSEIVVGTAQIQQTDTASNPRDVNVIEAAEVGDKKTIEATKSVNEEPVGDGISKTGERADSGDLKPNLNQ